MSLLPGEVLFSCLLTALCLRDKASVDNTYDQRYELFTMCGVDDLNRNRRDDVRYTGEIEIIDECWMEWGDVR